MSAAAITYDPQDQGPIAKAAAILFDARKYDLPAIPWFSHKGQQEAFLATVALIIDAAGTATTDRRARDAIAFWTLTIVYANKRMFRVATNAIKRDNWLLNDWTPARTFIDWIGSETHPTEIVRTSMAKWRD